METDLVGAAITFLALATATPAGPPLGAAAPDGSRVVERYIEAIGGRRALASIRSFHVRGSYSIPAAGLEGTIDLSFARPDHLLYEVDLPGFGKVRQGMSGGLGWSIDPRTGPEVHDGKRLDNLRKQALRGFSLLPGAEELRAGEVTVVEFEGRPCHAVAMSLEGTGITYTDFYDVETGLFAGRVETIPTAQGELEMRGTASDYRKFGEILIPTRWTHEAAGQEWTAVYESFEVNSVDTAVFETPDAIREKMAPGREP